MPKQNPLNTVDYKNTIFSPRWFMENMLQIVDKKNQLVKFVLNEEQSKLLAHIEFCLENDLPIRMIVLKARQIGATTFFTALGFWFAAMNRNITYGIVAHLLKSAESIFQKCKVFYNNLPRELQPATTQMSSEGITFDKKNGMGINSKIQFATVSEGVFRGQTLSYLHLTECAFWEGNVQAIENSLAPTVSINPKTIIVRESTANGYNFFKDDWDRAVAGKSEYTPFFFGWQDHQEYHLPVPKDFTLTDKEKQIKEKFNVTDEQLMWRRYQIDNNYGGNETWFAQENPMTPEEAFVAAGTGVFDAETIVAGYQSSVEPDEVELSSVPMFEKMKVWEYPEEGTELVHAQKAVWSDEKQDYEMVDTDVVVEEIHYQTPYTIGIDTSGMGADYNQLVVVNNVTKKVAARFGKKNLPEEQLAAVAVEIAEMYNNAMIVPEVNYSHEICNFILKLGYKNLYITESMARQDAKVVGGIQYGWKTTGLSKAPIISSLRSRLTSDPTLIQDRDFWYEAEYYLMEDPRMNKMNAANGHHDDIIMATAIAMYVSDSFQSKQTRTIVHAKERKHFMLDMVKLKKKIKIRRGVYNNNA
ncbi:MAG: terminase large subunit domain-containing protein [Bacilli bacterium]